MLRRYLGATLPEPPFTPTTGTKSERIVMVRLWELYLAASGWQTLEIFIYLEILVLVGLIQVRRPI
jgi:hypothetical protein